MTTLLLVRHGETYDNASQTMQGQTQGELNAAGIRQAETLRDQLANESIDAFVSSDLWRALQTARIIAMPHHQDVVTTPLLRERDWGDFTGRHIPDLKGLPFPDNVESLPCLMERARQFLNFISTNYPDQQVLAVGHGIINKAIQAVYYSKQMHEIGKMRNAEVRMLQLTNPYS
jgi:probable phosphoglycerate mutase